MTKPNFQTSDFTQNNIDKIAILFPNCITETKDADGKLKRAVNFELLQESYLGKVKMIYIDPPYNTGNDFIYRDNFVASSDEYEEESGTFDEEGNRLFKNTDTNGRFHSDWCIIQMKYMFLLITTI